VHQLNELSLHESFKQIFHHYIEGILRQSMEGDLHQIKKIHTII